MPVNPADSPILGTLYGSDAMRAVFDETTYFQRMLDVEAALARVQGRMGIIPAEAAAAIIAAGSDSDRSMDRPSGAPAIPDAAAFDAIGKKNWRSDAPTLLYFALETANGQRWPGACVSPECGEGWSRVGSALSGDMLPCGAASAAFVRCGRSPARLDG